MENILNFQFKYYQLGFKIIFHHLPENDVEIIYEDKQITVTTFPLNHRIPSSGFLFKEKPKERNLKKEVIDYYKLSIKDILKIKQGGDYVLSDRKIIENASLTYPPYKTRSYAFCSDTAYCPSIIPIIKGVDILYHESTFVEDMKQRAKETFHSTAKDAATIAKNACVGKLLLGHFSARYKNLSVFEEEAATIFENVSNVIERQTYNMVLRREMI